MPHDVPVLIMLAVYQLKLRPSVVAILFSFSQKQIDMAGENAQKSLDGSVISRGGYADGTQFDRYMTYLGMGHG